MKGKTWKEEAAGLETLNEMFQVVIEVCEPCSEKPVCTSKGQFKCSCKCHSWS